MEDYWERKRKEKKEKKKERQFGPVFIVKDQNLTVLRPFQTR